MIVMHVTASGWYRARRGRHGSGYRVKTDESLGDFRLRGGFAATLLRGEVRTL
ncbi:hypothetical protein RMSM_04521 [Rhodopirellula maiorica SM1]|uniref:Uncharacterized protein n=1 Tax=Rhodopirellula maiorica SM1 TaxID=1265738 RepID=M5RX79_9BACT|nr:hypothetical protein RMSM_04521 [Rhodopirellula maiorica SM1]